MYFNRGIALPDIYYLRLLAFTKGWRSSENTVTLTRALKNIVGLSPLPRIYAKCGSQLIAPGEMQPRDFKRSLRNLQPREWYWWLHTMELFARMGVIKQIPVLLNRLNELRKILREGDGFFPFRPTTSVFQKWNVYAGLALEDSWKDKRWKFDLTFRALLILKYAGML